MTWTLIYAILSVYAISIIVFSLTMIFRVKDITNKVEELLKDERFMDLDAVYGIKKIMLFVFIGGGVLFLPIKIVFDVKSLLQKKRGD